MTQNDWTHVFDLVRLFIASGIGIGFVAALVVAGQS